MKPILCAPLIRKTDRLLVELLGSLEAPEWDLPTVAGSWCVRDVAAHLLDTALRKLSMVRDGCFVEKPRIESSRDVIELVNRLNLEGVAVYRRLSPPLLIEWMRRACEHSADFHESLDPFAPATFAVSWAGEEQSLNWFDTARELTERWHHQQQIRLATNRPGILTRELYHPVLDCFLRGLPHAYRGVDAPMGALLRVTVTGECGGEWLLRRGEAGWELSERGGDAAGEVAVPEAVAWRMFTKGMTRDEALSHLKFRGDESLGRGLLRLTAIVG